jgi:hypothetical protein
MERLTDGTELQLESRRFVDTSLNLHDTNHPAFVALKSEIANVLGAPVLLTMESVWRADTTAMADLLD